MKTIKDIYFVEGYGKEQDELKQEAINYIRILEDTSFCPCVNKGLILWIRDFFNILDEDLKLNSKQEDLILARDNE